MPRLAALNIFLIFKPTVERKKMTCCSVHPTVGASWECGKCGNYFCSECILKREKSNFSKEKIHLCPKCIIPALSTGHAAGVEPFWTKMHRFFLYPLSAIPLILIICVSIGQFILNYIPFVSVYMKILLAGMMVKYSFDVLQQTAMGDTSPPSFRFDDIGSDMKPLVLQTMLYILLFGAAIYAATKGPVLFLLVSAVSMLAFPAMIILIAATGSLLKAINPLYFGGLIIRIGGGYFIMLLFLSILLGAPALISYKLRGILPDWTISFFETFAGCYYMIVMYHLMGYVMLQYSNAIGYDVDQDKMAEMLEAKTRKQISASKSKSGPESASGIATSTINNPNSELKNRIEMNLREGKLSEALAEIRECIDIRNITDPEISGFYYDLLKMTGADQAELSRHAVSYLDILADKNDRKKGLEVFSFSVKADSNFSASPKALLKIGGWLNETGKTEMASKILERIIKFHSDDPAAPHAYFRISQILHDGLLQKEKSISMLKELLVRFPDHETAEKAKKYLAHISGASA